MPQTTIPIPAPLKSVTVTLTPDQIRSMAISAVGEVITKTGVVVALPADTIAMVRIITDIFTTGILNQSQSGLAWRMHQESQSIHRLARDFDASRGQREDDLEMLRRQL